MKDIKISIIIPIYNPGNELINSLNSAILQDLEEIEIICVNDGSTDNSSELLEKYAKRDSRIKIINQNNSGAGIARNNAIKHAQGEYILFLDSDDWIEENTCVLLYNYAQKLDADLVLFDCLIHRDQYNKELRFLDETYENTLFDYENIKDKVFNGPLGVIWNKFYKTKYLKENNIYFPNHKLFNDVEFHIKTMTLTNKITYIKNLFYHYNNITHFSLQKSYVGTGDSVVFYDVMSDVREFLIINNLMNKCRYDFLEFSFFEFKIKLENIDSNYSQEYYLKIKKFFESMKICVKDFEEKKLSYLTFYVALNNTTSYEEFILIENQIKGLIDNEIEIIQNIKQNTCNELIMNIIENNLNENKLKELDELKNKLIHKN